MKTPPPAQEAAMSYKSQSNTITIVMLAVLAAIAITAIKVFGG
jgi:hypothetical protein